MRYRFFVIWIALISFVEKGFSARRFAKPEDLNHVQLIQGCLNELQPTDKWSVKTSWQRVVTDSRSRYRVVGTWWSKATESHEVGVTVVTHAAFEDREQLKHLCRSWQVGQVPISHQFRHVDITLNITM